MPVPVFVAFKQQNHSFEDIIGRAYLDVRYKANGRTEQFLRKGMALMFAGTATGLLASLALRRLAASQISLVSPRDPLTLTAVATLVFLIGLAACVPRPPRC